MDKASAVRHPASPFKPPSARATTARPATTLRRSRTKKGATLLLPWVQVLGSGVQARAAELGGVPGAVALTLDVRDGDQGNVPGCSTLQVSWQTNSMSPLKDVPKANRNATMHQQQTSIQVEFKKYKIFSR